MTLIYDFCYGVARILQPTLVSPCKGGGRSGARTPGPRKVIHKMRDDSDVDDLGQRTRKPVMREAV
jgi:hypothetical protein